MCCCCWVLLGAAGQQQLMASSGETLPFVVGGAALTAVVECGRVGSAGLLLTLHN